MFDFLIWLMFLFGLGFHVLFQIEAIVAAKNNTASSRWQIFKDRRNAFLIRGFLNVCAFGVFFGGGADALLPIVKLSAPEWLHGLHMAMHSSVGPFVAGFAGYTVDSLLAFVPSFKSYIPPEQ